MAKKRLSALMQLEVSNELIISMCSLRMLLRLHHYLDRVHSDLNNMLFVQYVDRESRYNMWSRVKALLSCNSKGIPLGCPIAST